MSRVLLTKLLITLVSLVINENQRREKTMQTLYDNCLIKLIVIKKHFPMNDLSKTLWTIYQRHDKLIELCKNYIHKKICPCDLGSSSVFYRIRRPGHYM